jgi:hypothetical protein
MAISIRRELAEPLKKLLDCIENDTVVNVEAGFGWGYDSKFCEAMDHARYSYGRYLETVREERMTSEEYKRYLMSKGVKLTKSPSPEVEKLQVED